ncbi:terminase TerL endonuclease subunit [Sphingomonas sp. CD22]|uniref:terminase large subunit n=1 Tax=Sphingomonas sp. CD22 TaxID=3100214 RepID=UPI002ADFFD49|nr:terminase TerL endonuclease subunit [Sphingomonas sp. CD22]MEA1083222.1 terminase TerL endonuclease subunit [Sphingomonas sp. CD22]
MPNRFLTEADPTTAWAKAAVAGEFVVGELVRHAAERHLRDMRDGARRGIYWRPEEAAHALGFLPAVFSVTDGPAEGQPFHPLEWHTFVIGSLFGWRNSTGRWRFRHAWLETGKGQAKSPLMGAIGLYVMGWCGIPRAQVFAIGQDKATAGVLFRDSVAMCRGQIPDEDPGDTLEQRQEVIIRGEGDNAWMIEHPETQSFFRKLAGGDAQSGPRPACVLADEIHEFKSDHSIETWRRAIDKIAGNAIMVMGTNTPATNQHVGQSYSNVYQQIARGEKRDDSAFAFIARIDKADRETVFENESCWKKSLPALGETFPIENIRETVASAVLRPSTKSSVKRLYFGIDVGAADFWMDEERFKAVLGPIDTRALKGQPCYLSLDLSLKNDLTALTATWIGDEGHLSSKSWYWTVADGLKDRAERDQAPYVEWVEDKFLTALPGAVIDYTFVAKQVAALNAEQEIDFLAFDAAFMAEFEAACVEVGLQVWRWEGPGKPEGKGLKLVAHAQGTKVMFEDRQLCMPTSITKLEDSILDNRITIDDSPVTYSCASNVELITDGQSNRAFDKKKSRGRIDGMVTIAMGAGAARMNEKPKKKSVYAARGVIRV